jgi:hypothetical protein
LAGVGKAGQPDLVVTGLDTLGQADFDEGGNARLPIRFAVKNEGDAAADIFKVAVTYTYTNSDSVAETAVAAFEATATDEVDPADKIYPFTRNILPVNSEVIFEGIAIFAEGKYSPTVSLTAIADSCFDEDVGMIPCRVEESDEKNNVSEPLLVRLFIVVE